MSSSFPLMPHAVCWRADPQLVWTMVITNAITFLSYVSICLTLLWLVSRTRRVIARDWGWFALGFALFIVACGTTHLMEVITTWIPVFWVDATTNIITAVLSASVAFMLVRRAPVIGFGINDYSDRLGNTEKEKAQMQESLLDAQKLQEWSRLSAVVSHEIGNPLEAIQNLLYLIRETEGIEPGVVSLANSAAHEADRVLQISRSTLSFFRESANAEPVNLQSAAESVRFLLSTVLHERSATLNIRSNGDVTVEALAGETRQVLLNLARNAVEASTTPGAHVDLSLSGKPGGVEIIVADHGVGIDPAVACKLFNFGVTSKGEHGNGMGLWMVKHILTRHGGDIKVASQPGKGTTFTLWWPRAFVTTPA